MSSKKGTENKTLVTVGAGAFGPFGTYNDLKDKTAQVQYYVSQQLRKLARAFKISGLPDTIPERDLKILLLTNGHCVITDVQADIVPEDKRGLYALTGFYGGYPNAYYMPTTYTVANPYLNYDAILKVGDDCVLLKNDTMFQGMLPMFNRYASLLVENDITMRMAQINTRLALILSAGDDNAKKSAEGFIDKIIQGDLSVIADPKFVQLAGVKTQPGANANNNILPLIELEQYLKGSWAMDIGLKSAFNMKREAISATEAALNDDILYPTIDDILECWREGFEEVNAKYGTNISVELEGAWDTRRELEDLEISEIEAEIDVLEQQAESEEVIEENEEDVKEEELPNEDTD